VLEHRNSIWFKTILGQVDFDAPRIAVFVRQRRFRAGNDNDDGKNTGAKAKHRIDLHRAASSRIEDPTTSVEIDTIVTAAVTSFPEGGAGLDMVGNVAEWVAQHCLWLPSPQSFRREAETISLLPSRLAAASWPNAR
jgi:formylglycine-generating enzyme required for sulfatase activity